jgi:hypothetical protein
MPLVYEASYPAPATPENGYATLAAAVILETVADLEGANTKRRQQAQEARTQEGSGISAIMVRPPVSAMTRWTS